MVMKDFQLGTDLRHTADSLILMHAIPMLAVFQILGYNKPNSTPDLYGHTIPGIQHGLGAFFRARNDCSQLGSGYECGSWILLAPGLQGGR